MSVRATTQVEALRQASPYINAFRGHTVVLHCAQAALSRHVRDLALLHQLGIRLVVVLGLRQTIDQHWHGAGLSAPRFHQGQRITSTEAIDLIAALNGQAQATLAAALSVGLPNSPTAGMRITVVHGNFVSARPLGIHDGVDFERTGVVRRIDATAINSILASGHMVTLSALAPARTGENYNLRSEDVAAETATALNADKLIYLLDHDGPQQDGTLLRQCTPAQAEHWLSLHPDAPSALAMRMGNYAVRHGVRRVQLIPAAIDGGILAELFSFDGCGTLISGDGYDAPRAARERDIPGIVALIEPLQHSGVLVTRDALSVSTHIDHFAVVERDGRIVACAALFDYGDCAEFASLATDPRYRNDRHGARLLAHLMQRAKSQGKAALFALTTQSVHWFLEQGFHVVDAEQLPSAKRTAMDLSRRSQVLWQPL